MEYFCSPIVKVKCCPGAKLREGYRKKDTENRAKTGRPRGFLRLEWTTDKPRRYSEKKNNISARVSLPHWEGSHTFSERALILASAWRTVRPSSREPHDRDLRDPKGLFLLVPGVITGAVVSLADSGSRAHYPPFRMTPHWGAFPTSLNSSSWDGLWFVAFHFSSWRRYCQEVDGNALWKETAFYSSQPAWSQKMQCYFYGFTLGQMCLKHEPEGSDGVGSSVAKDRENCLKMLL